MIIHSCIVRQTQAFLISFVLASCMDRSTSNVGEVQISLSGTNALNTVVQVKTPDESDVYLKYWLKGQEKKIYTSRFSEAKKDHSVLLQRLEPGQHFSCRIISKTKSGEGEANIEFNTMDMVGALLDTFQVDCKDPSALPSEFREGYVMVHRRESPGMILIFNSDGNIVWFHEARQAGFKVVHFTANKTLLCLLGTREYDRGYGNAIMELSLNGDTLLYLQKGQNDFNQTVHHEVIQNKQNQLVTLCMEERVIDLRTKGGLERDTVHGDGILVMDRQGRKIWKWTVFDELNPLEDTSIIRNKKDWMHANSISFDKDDNYLVSFYNNGQIWKIDAHSGKVIWKLGRNGDFEIPMGYVFDQAHTAHINSNGSLMLFDNGGMSKLSRTLAYRLDLSSMKARIELNSRLAPEYFSERMGSSYLVAGNHLLQCISKHKIVALTNLKGEFLWKLTSKRLMSYRAEFIPRESLSSLIVPLQSSTN